MKYLPYRSIHKMFEFILQHGNEVNAVWLRYQVTHCSPGVLSQFHSSIPARSNCSSTLWAIIAFPLQFHHLGIRLNVIQCLALSAFEFNINAIMSSVFYAIFFFALRLWDFILDGCGSSLFISRMILIYSTLINTWLSFFAIMNNAPKTYLLYFLCTSVRISLECN
jgi:hypothetical protein